MQFLWSWSSSRIYIRRFEFLYVLLKYFYVFFWISVTINFLFRFEQVFDFAELLIVYFLNLVFEF